jgi:hypothetical protein
MVNEVRELFDFINSRGMSVYYDYSGSRAASTQQEETRDDNSILCNSDTVLITNSVFGFLLISSCSFF